MDIDQNLVFHLLGVLATLIPVLLVWTTSHPFRQSYGYLFSYEKLANDMIQIKSEGGAQISNLERAAKLKSIKRYYLLYTFVATLSLFTIAVHCQIWTILFIEMGVDFYGPFPFKSLQNLQLHRTFITIYFLAIPSLFLLILGIWNRLSTAEVIILCENNECE